VENGWQPADPDVARLRDRLQAGLAALDVRLVSVEGAVTSWRQRAEDQQTEHRTRVWQAALAIITGVVLPLSVIGIVALVHALEHRGG
jgi:hypothetical protein